MPSNKLKKPLFVTGVGTDVGKTIVSAILCEYYEAKYWKPIQTGKKTGTDNDTLLELVSHSQFECFPEAYLFNEPLSPHVASEIENKNILLSQIKLPTEDPNLIIEGAGGVLVPLNYQNQTICDLIESLNCSVVLVVKEYLGNINHTLLSLEYLKMKNIDVTGLVYVGDALPKTAEIIENMTGIKTLFRVPIFPLLNKDSIRKFVQEIQHRHRK